MEGLSERSIASSPVAVYRAANSLSVRDNGEGSTTNLRDVHGFTRLNENPAVKVVLRLVFSCFVNCWDLFVLTVSRRAVCTMVETSLVPVKQGWDLVPPERNGVFGI